MAKQSKLPPLTEPQLEIMSLVWERGEITVGQAWRELSARRELARNTVQTTLMRLEEKGWLKHREQGRTFIYSAKRPRKASLGARVAQMVDRFFAGSPEDMVTALIEYRGLSQDETDRIRAMIDKAEQELEQQRNTKRK